MLANPDRLVADAIAAVLAPPPPFDYLAFAEEHISFTKRESHTACVVTVMRRTCLEDRHIVERRMREVRLTLWSYSGSDTIQRLYNLGVEMSLQ